MATIPNTNVLAYEASAEPPYYPICVAGVDDGGLSVNLYRDPDDRIVGVAVFDHEGEYQAGVGLVPVDLITAG